MGSVAVLLINRPMLWVIFYRRSEVLFTFRNYISTETNKQTINRFEQKLSKTGNKNYLRTSGDDSPFSFVLHCNVFFKVRSWHRCHCLLNLIRRTMWRLTGVFVSLLATSFTDIYMCLHDLYDSHNLRSPLPLVLRLIYDFGGF